MMIKDVVDFLIPQNDPLQIIFFAAIFGTGILTVVSVKIWAREAKWENKWNGGTADDTSDDLDAEHGSVHDICLAVASKAENLAEIMPGILLIIGLLGTFLGLGMALDKASTILLDANSASGGMDDAMTNLMGMMQGLGTKFKTSTWGIIGFLMLKAWASWDGFEEKRLRWCIRKFKRELDNRRSEENERLKVESDQQKEEKSKELELTRQANAALQVIGNLLKLQLKKSEEMEIHSIATRKALESFVEANNSNIESMKNSSTQMADAAGRVGESAIDLKSAIENFKNGVTDVMGVLKSDLKTTITEMNESFGKNMDDISKNLIGATNGITEAVSLLSENVGKTMDNMNSSINKSVETQNTALSIFSETAQTLSISVQSMTNRNEQLCKDIKSSLTAVSDSGRRMVSLDERYKGITESVEKVTESATETTKEIRDLVNQVKESVSQKQNEHKSFEKMLSLLENIDNQILVYSKSNSNQSMLTKVD